MATLRYSPRNWLAIHWPFDTCSLPEPMCPVEPDESSGPACKPKPVIFYPDTYDWARFLPEVMVGVEEPDQDIAANYVRQAAIEFARDAHVLQRELVVDLEPGLDEYELPPFPHERIAGTLSLSLDDRHDDCRCGLSGRSNLGFSWVFDTSRHVLRFFDQPKYGRVTIRVYAVPTEDACAYDKFLYDNFRADITVGARRYYVLANHFRDRALVSTLPPQERWNFVILAALRQAHRVPTARKQNSGSGMWAGGHGIRTGRYYR